MAEETMERTVTQRKDAQTVSILLVDDCDHDAFLLEQELINWGYVPTISRVKEREELMLALERDWDFIISDHQLPSFDSMQALQLLQNSGIKIPFIILSRVITDEIATRALCDGACDYINKNHLPRLRPVMKRELARRAHQRQLEEQLTLHREQFSALHVNQPVAVFECHTTQRPRWNSHFETLTGFNQRNFTLASLLALLTHNSRHTLVKHYRIMRRNKHTSLHCEVQLGYGPARFHWMALTLSVAYREKGRSIVISALDTTEQRNIAAHMEYLEQRDPATGMLNRAAFTTELDLMLASSMPGNKYHALIIVDIDRFQMINDGFGYQLGDQLLREIGQRITFALRQGDHIARINGDNFAILMRDMHDQLAVGSWIGQLRSAFCKPFVLDAQPLLVTFSAGIALHDGSGSDSSELFANAEKALRQAKAHGGNGYDFYRSDLYERTRELLMLEHDLFGALERGEFQLHYQPKVDAMSGELTGLEALIRWNHPTRGMVPPAEFIPIAERNGLIVEIGFWVAEEGCRQLAEWRALGYSLPRLAINISGRQFREPSLAERLIASIDKYGVMPHSLEIEITEGTLIVDTDKAITTLNDLKNHGLRIAIDDFGTGYSSLSYLRRFPLDTLKIDRSFVTEIEFDSGAAAVARSIITLANNLRMETVAEGVENSIQLHYLRDHGCDHIQGYYISPPLSPQELLRYLAVSTAATQSQAG